MKNISCKQIPLSNWRLLNLTLNISLNFLRKKNENQTSAFDIFVLTACREINVVQCNWNHGFRKCFKKRRAKVLGFSALAEIKRTCLRRKKFLIGDWRWSICRLRFLPLWFSIVVISYNSYNKIKINLVFFNSSYTHFFLISKVVNFLVRSPFCKSSLLLLKEYCKFYWVERNN